MAILRGRGRDPRRGGREIVRHGASSFLGEMQPPHRADVLMTAVVTKPLRYVAVDRDALRALLFEDGPFSDLVLSTFIGAARGAATDRRSRPRDRRPALLRGDDADARVRPQPITSRSPGRTPLRRGSGALPLVRLPGGAELRGRRRARSPARSGSAASWRRVKRSTCSSSAAARPGSARPSTAPQRASTRSSSRARRSAARPALASNRELPRLPGRDHRLRADEPRGHARRASSALAPATPYRAVVARAGRRTPHRPARGGHEIAARAVAARDRARSTGGCRSSGCRSSKG